VDELFDKTDDSEDKGAALRGPEVEGRGDTDEAFSRSDVVVKERYIQQRLLPTAIEPRATVAYPDPGHDGYVMYTATQVPHLAKIVLSLRPDTENQIRVVAPDVGGGFGSKLNVYREEILALVLTKRLGTPVKWDRRPLGELPGDDPRARADPGHRAGRDVRGKILGLRVKLLDDLGAYLQLLTPAIAVSGAAMFPGVYTFDAFSIEIKGVFTNLTPTDAYRGAGRPEAATPSRGPSTPWPASWIWTRRRSGARTSTSRSTSRPRPPRPSVRLDEHAGGDGPAGRDGGLRGVAPRAATAA
jgi:CO/xanthine dehydrogenase Mo-binding subunit